MRMFSVTGAIVAVMLAAASALACLWDRDTLNFEALGLPGAAETITGRIDRQPDLYYQMRLDRVAKELANAPERLDLYDDAGVACDRLKRGDEAIEWMARKKTRLDAMDTSVDPGKEHLYRYHANLGTFMAHRWFRAGKNRENMEDLQRGREHIALAVEINPNAHFGRERVQLKAMDWVIRRPSVGTGREFPTIMDMEDPPLFTHTHAPSPQARSLVVGLLGLIALGDAWESLDVFIALSAALECNGESWMAELASQRARELFEGGTKSLSPEAQEFLSEGEFAKQLWRGVGGFYEIDDQRSVSSYFKRARANADVWRQERESFMVARLASGEHPDTHPEFWKGYEPRQPVELPGAAFGPQVWLGVKVVGVLGGGIVTLLVLPRLVRRLVQANQRMRERMSA